MGATKTLNSGLLFQTGHVIKITSRVRRIHKLVGAISAGVIRGNAHFTTRLIAKTLFRD